MTSPPLPIGGSSAAGRAAPPPPPPPPPAGGSNITDTVSVTSSVTATVSTPGSSAVPQAVSVTSSVTATVSNAPSGAVPAFSHVVMVVLENHGYTQIVGSPNAPYLNSLIAAGAALFTDSHGGPDVLHPSFPNYMQLFSGGTQGVSNDNCPPAGQPYSVLCQASSLINGGKTFGGYAESRPASFTACGPSPYAGRHVPWVWFTGYPQTVHKDFSAFPTTSGGYAALEHMSWVVPDLSHDMHSFGSFTDAQVIQNGDTWVRQHLDGYAQWAKTNNSLLVVQLDEDNFTTADRIPTIFYGQHVKPGQYGEHITHYNILRTLSDIFAVKPPGKSATATPVTDCWN